MNEHALIEALERDRDPEVLQERLSVMAGLLGALCASYYDQDFTDPHRRTVLGLLDGNFELREWWAANREWYRRHLAANVAAAQREKERAEAKRVRLVRKALKKLTPKERAAMGYTLRGV